MKTRIFSVKNINCLFHEQDPGNVKNVEQCVPFRLWIREEKAKLTADQL
jgi:hypothetical protein